MYNASAIHEWTVDRITQILDNNDAEVAGKLGEAARDGILHGMGTGLTREDYERALNDRGQTTRYQYASVVGIYVVDALTDYLNEQRMPDLVRTLLMDLLDLGNRAQRDMLGDHYLPDVDDVDWPDEEDGDDGE